MWFKQKIKPEKVKIKNTKELREHGIEVIEHLPYLDQPKFRSAERIAKRMMVSLALFQLYLKAPRGIIENWLKANGLFDSMTEEEKQFLKSDYKYLPEQDQVDIYWFIEALWAFAWIGGLHNKLTLNTGVEDSLSSMLPNISNNEPAQNFISGYKLRNESEIFKMLDRFYRAHWFARNNDLSEKKSDKVDLDLIIERRKALEFTCYSNYKWDEISLDT